MAELRAIEFRTYKDQEESASIRSRSVECPLQSSEMGKSYKEYIGPYDTMTVGARHHWSVTTEPSDDGKRKVVTGGSVISKVTN